MGNKEGNRNIRSVIAIGSNLTDRYSHLQRGVDEWRKVDGVSVKAVSHVYDNPPEGEGFDQNFLNAVIVLDTSLSAGELLKTCKQIEAKCGRDKKSSQGDEKRNRTLDCDVIFYGDGKFEIPGMKVPHPRWNSRPFVVIPLLDVIDLLTEWQAGEVRRVEEMKDIVDRPCERIENMLN